VLASPSVRIFRLKLSFLFRFLFFRNFFRRRLGTFLLKNNNEAKDWRPHVNFSISYPGIVKIISDTANIDEKQAKRIRVFNLSLAQNPLTGEIVGCAKASTDGFPDYNEMPTIVSDSERFRKDRHRFSILFKDIDPVNLLKGKIEAKEATAFCLPSYPLFPIEDPRPFFDSKGGLWALAFLPDNINGVYHSKSVLLEFKISGPIDLPVAHVLNVTGLEAGPEKNWCFLEEVDGVFRFRRSVFPNSIVSWCSNRKQVIECSGSFTPLGIMPYSSPGSVHEISFKDKNYFINAMYLRKRYFLQLSEYTTNFALFSKTNPYEFLSGMNINTYLNSSEYFHYPNHLSQFEIKGEVYFGLMINQSDVRQKMKLFRKKDLEKAFLRNLKLDETK
jgi:hypothetical protein